MRRFLASFVALAGLVLAAPVCRAGQTTFAGVTAMGSSAFVYTPGINGGLAIADGSSFIALFLFPPGYVDVGSKFSLTNFHNSGTVVAVSGNYEQPLTGGDFALTSAGGVDLLSGNFSSAELLATDPLPNSQGSFLTTILGVNYTGGTYFTDSGLSTPGGFSFGLTSVSPALTVSNGYFTPFVAGGSGTFSAGTLNTTNGANSIPAPPMLLAAAALIGLATISKTLRAKRHSIRTML